MILGVQWYYWLILIIAVIVAIIAWIKVYSSGKERKARMKREAEIWRRDYELREKYSVLTEEKLRSCDDTELLHAVAMNIQVQLENTENMILAFNNLPQVKKNIYTLEYFDEDAKTSLSTFFRNNGAPLVPNILNALNDSENGKLLSLVSKVYPMFDDDSEISIDYAVVDKTDAEFKEVYSSEEFLRLAAKYIKDNKNIILNIGE